MFSIRKHNSDCWLVDFSNYENNLSCLYEVTLYNESTKGPDILHVCCDEMRLYQSYQSNHNVYLYVNDKPVVSLESLYQFWTSYLHFEHIE